MKTHNGPKLQRDLILGVPELSLMQGALTRNARVFDRLETWQSATVRTQAGIHVDDIPGGVPDDHWKIKVVSTNLEIETTSIMPGSENRAYGWDEDGDLHSFIDGDSQAPAIAVWTADDVWYTIEMGWELTDYEEGTLTMTNGSATITGANTELSRHAFYDDDDLGRGTKITIEAGDTTLGHDGTYEFKAFTSDTSITLRSNASGSGVEAGIPFKVLGQFFGTAPADPDGNRRKVPVLYKVAQSRFPSTAGRIVLADVMRPTAGGTYVMDRREGSVRRRRTPHRALMAQWLVQEQAAVASTSVLARTGTLVWTGAAAHKPGDICQLRGQNGYRSSFLGCAVQQTSNAIDVHRLDPHGNVSGWSGGIATITTLGGGPITNVRLVSASPKTNLGGEHWVFYRGADSKIYAHYDDTSGTNFGVGSAVWDMTTESATDTIASFDVIITQHGRIIIVAEYFDDSANGGAGHYDIRFAFSDDNGDTWDTNTGAGYLMYTDATFGSVYKAPTIAQLPDGTLVTAFAVDTAGINVIVGESPVSPIAVQGTAGGSTVLTPAAGAAVVSASEGQKMRATANGELILFQHRSGTSIRMFQLGLYNAQTAYFVNGFPIWDSTCGNGTSGTMAWAMGRSGLLILLMEDEAATPDTVYGVTMFLTSSGQTPGLRDAP